MGSFNIACSATNQIIAEGNRCYVLPMLQCRTFSQVDMIIRTRSGRETDAEIKEESVAQYGASHSRCGLNAFWDPAGGFISGMYADYGRIEPDDTPMNREALLDFIVRLLKDAPIVKQGENSSHDLPFDLRAFMDEYTPALIEKLRATNRFELHTIAAELAFTDLKKIWGYTWEVSQEHRLFLRDYGQVLRPVGFAAFHECTFKELVDRGERSTNWEGQSMQIDAFLTRAINETEQSIQEYLDGKGNDTPEEQRNMRRYIMWDRLREGMQMGMSTDGGSKVLNPFYGTVSNAIQEYSEGRRNREDLLAALRPVQVQMYALWGMGNLELQLAPFAYGGQDYDNTKGRQYAKFISAVAKQVTNKQKEIFS